MENKKTINMKIRITAKKMPICPAPAFGTVHDVIFTDKQLPEFIKTHGENRYHINYQGRDTVICENECEIIK